MAFIELEGKRYYMSDQQRAVFERIKSDKEKLTLAKRVGREAPFDQEMRVATARAGMIGTELGPNAVVKTESPKSEEKEEE